MNSALRFLKTTVVGGILFLVPVIVLIVIAGKAFGLMKQVAAPLSKVFPIDGVGDVALVNVAATLLIVLVSFLAGLIAKTAIAGRAVQSLETRVLSNIPIYDLLKTKIQATIQSADTSISPVLARFDDCWQIALEVERLADGKVVLFLPGSPDPWAGSVCFVTEDRVAPLDSAVLPVLNSLRGLGKGSQDVVRTRLQNI